MNPRKITEDLTVSPQIDLEDIPQIAALGFKTLICNRPDHEDPGQPTFDEIAEAAAMSGMTALFQPVASGMVLDEDAIRFSRALDEAPKPVFAYCRSGTRCTILWSLAQVGSMSADDILATAERAGYNLAGMAHRLEP